MYNWDGNVSSFSGRQVRVTNNYQNVSFGSGIYTHTNLIADALMVLNDSLGRDLADELIFAACFGLGPGTTFYDFGRLIAFEDSIRYNKAHYNIINQAFLKNQIFTTPLALPEPVLPKAVEVYISGTLDFALGGALMIETNDSNISKVEVFNLAGKLVYKTEPRNNTIKLSSEAFSPAAYILKVTTSSKVTNTLKVIKR